MNLTAWVALVDDLPRIGREAPTLYEQYVDMLAEQAALTVAVRAYLGLGNSVEDEQVIEAAKDWLYTRSYAP